MTTRINLLPWREIRRKEQDRQLLSIGVGAWILMALIVFYAHLHVSGMIDTQNKRNEFLEQEIAKLEDQLKEIKALKAQRDALIARMQVIQQLQANRTQVVHLFDDLVRKVPEGVYLRSFTQKGTGLTLTGIAQSNARVSAFMRNLDGSDWFVNPDLDVINVTAQGSERVSQFTLRVTQQKKQKDPKS
jgi:type IV pilus assembly protein PilN